MGLFHSHSSHRLESGYLVVTPARELLGDLCQTMVSFNRRPFPRLEKVLDRSLRAVP